MSAGVTVLTSGLSSYAASAGLYEDSPKTAEHASEATSIFFQFFIPIPPKNRYSPGEARDLPPFSSIQFYYMYIAMFHSIQRQERNVNPSYFVSSFST